MEKHTSKPNPNIRQIMVELEITDVNNLFFPFPTNRELDKSARIIAIESFHADVVAYTPTGKTVVTKAVHNKTFLRLADSTQTLLRMVPLSVLTVDASRNQVNNLNLASFDMQQSGVQISEKTGIVANSKFLFLITYEKKGNQAEA